MQTDLNYIYEVWRTGSFSQAAKKLFLSQPALSIAVRKYEQRMGMPIFDRSTQPLQLTPAGEIVLRHIFALQAEEKNLQTAIRDLQALDHGSLSLAATQYFSCYVLSDVLRQFHAQYPKVNVTIYEQNANTIDSLLMKIYEDMYTGRLQEDTAQRMTEKYQQESSTLSSEYAELQECQRTADDTKAAYDEFFALTEQFSDVDKLTPEILSTFIERIEVEPKVYPPGVKVYARSKIPYEQTIHIYYKFIGERPGTISSKPA